MYQIVQQYPVHCQITDGIIGSGYVRQPMTYSNLRYAHKLAARLTDECYNHCGDDSFHVIRAGDECRNTIHPNRDTFPSLFTTDDDCIPF